MTGPAQPGPGHLVVSETGCRPRGQVRDRTGTTGGERRPRVAPVAHRGEDVAQLFAAGHAIGRGRGQGTLRGITLPDDVGDTQLFAEGPRRGPVGADQRVHLPPGEVTTQPGRLDPADERGLTVGDVPEREPGPGQPARVDRVGGPAEGDVVAEQQLGRIRLATEPRHERRVENPVAPLRRQIKQHGHAAAQDAGAQEMFHRLAQTQIHRQRQCGQELSPPRQRGVLHHSNIPPSHPFGKKIFRWI